jgi:hypothetical protein
MRTMIPIVLLATLSQSPSSSRVGTSLARGMELHYESNGVTTPWTIDSVDLTVAVAGQSQCSRIVLRIGDGQPQSRTHCVAADTMWNWDERTQRLVLARRLSPGLLEITANNGGLVRFLVMPVDSSSIGGRQFMVLPTMVTTYDSTGAPLRRLIERFAPALATATEGVFEVPDTANAADWRVVQQFQLTAVKPPQPQ